VGRKAVELRDNDKVRFDGKAVRQAIANMKGEIRDALIGQDPGEQAKINRMLLISTARLTRGGSAPTGPYARTFASADDEHPPCVPDS
jgi:hypothetical protein